MANKERRSEFDIMRSFAIFIIIFHHLPAYCFNYYDLNNFGISVDLSFVNDLNRYFALGIFIYISGYLLQLSRYDLSSARATLLFLYRRFLRIMPLYYLALIFFVIYLVGKPISTISLVDHLLGLQLIISTPSLEPVQTLWFVGLIVSYYLVFIALNKYGTNVKRAIIIAALIPILALLAKVFVGIIDKRLFIYYAVFLFGMYMSLNSSLLTKKIVLGAATVLFVASTFLYASYIFPVLNNNDVTPKLFSVFSLSAFVLLNIIMLSFVVLVHYTCTKIKLSLRIVFLVSYASYCIYLFHRPIWAIMLNIHEPRDDGIRGIYLSLVGVPIIVFASYYMQKWYDMALARIRR